MSTTATSSALTVGFSLGGFVAQELALVRQRLVRRLVLAGTAPQGASGIHRWPDEVYALTTPDVPNPEGFIRLFFSGPDETRDPSKLARLGGITQPTLVARGDNDKMMLTENSGLLAKHLPNARLSIYPDSGHGFLDQYPEEFGQDVRAFLDGD